MNYDRNLTLGSDNISSNIRVNWDLIETNPLNSVYNLKVDLLMNLPGDLEYNLDTTFVKVTRESYPGNPEYSLQGPLVEPSEIGGYLNTKALMENAFYIPNTAGASDDVPPPLVLRGRIYLSNNTFFVLNKNLEIGQFFINSYFNPTN